MQRANNDERFKQKNTKDCGVFTCVKAYKILKKGSFDIVQTDMLFFRAKIFIALWNNQI